LLPLVITLTRSAYILTSYQPERAAQAPGRCPAGECSARRLTLTRLFNPVEKNFRPWIPKKSGLRYDYGAVIPSVQTKRPGDAWLVSVLLGG